MIRDVLIVALGTIKLFVLIGMTVLLTKNKTKGAEISIPIIGAFVFMWATWIIVYIAQIHPFILPEIVDDGLGS